MCYSHSPLLRRFAWGASGGSISGFQNFLKDALTLVKAANNPDMDDKLPVGLLTVLILLAIVCAFGGLLLLTACMKRYNATYSASMYVGSFVISASIMSAIHYETLSNLEDLKNQILYPTGLAILMGGVSLLATEKHDEETRISPAVSRRNSASSIVMVMVGPENGATCTEGDDDSYNDLI